MEEGAYYIKRLCMSEMHVQYSQYGGSHFFDAGSGKRYSSFGFLEKGTAVLNTPGRHVMVPEGSLFYIPDGIRYHSVWTGEPEIRFYSIHLVMRRYEPEFRQEFDMQRIEGMSVPETGTMFRQIYELTRSGEKPKQLRALSLFYGFYADVIPLMREASPQYRGETVSQALAYIGEHSAEEFSVAHLASECHVSESTLYHLFREETGLSPVRYRNECRVEQASRLLCDTDKGQAEIASECGFRSESYFRAAFSSVSGMSPSAYRKLMKKK